MDRLNRFAAATSKNARSLRLLWTLIALGLVALGTAAPSEWDIP